MKKNKVKSANINSFLYLGLGLIVATAVINLVFKSIPSLVTTVLYIVGVAALVLYMWEIQYRRRTGDYNDESASNAAKKAKNRK